MASLPTLKTGFVTEPTELRRGGPIANATRPAQPEGPSVVWNMVRMVVNCVLMVLNPVIMIWNQETPIFNPIWNPVLHLLGA